MLRGSGVRPKWSGVGKPSVRIHWHALLHCPDDAHLEGVVRELWRQRLGNAHVVRYAPELPGAYYMHKLVANGAPTWEYGLDQLTYDGPTDLIQATELNDFVPRELKGKTFGEYLRVG